MSQKECFIYHTNDLHSHFEQWGKIVTFMKRTRLSHQLRQEESMYVDLGDHTDRSALITEGTAGKANVQLLNALQVDAITIGNNEGITFSKQELDALYEEADFSVLVANLKEQDGTFPKWLQPYQIKTLQNGMKIGMIGFTFPYELFYQQIGWRVEDPYAIIQQLVDEVRAQADVVLILSHLGLSSDEWIAEHVNGIDVILGGHTHHLLKQGKLVNDTLIAQVGRYGHFVGQVKLVFDDTTKKICKKEAGAISIDSLPVDEEAAKLLDQLEEEAKKNLAAVVTTLDQPIFHSWFESSELADLLAEGLAKWCDAEVSMLNAGVLLHGLPKGPVTYDHIHAICPHPINPCKVTIRGDKLKEIIMASFSADMQKLRVRGLGFRGRIMGMMAFYGIEVTTTWGADGLNHVTTIRINGEPIQPSKNYVVATLDMFTFGPLFPEMSVAKEKNYYLPEFIRDVLMWKLKNK